MATSNAINQPLQMLDLARSQSQQGAAIGGAIAQAGGMLEQIAMKRLEAKNYADMAEAENEAQGAMAKHLDWRMRNPNPEGWAANFEETFAKTRSSIEGRGFAPLVREKLKISLDSLAMKGRIDVGLAATKTEIDRALTAADSKYKLGIKSGNMGMVQEGVNGFMSLTDSPPEVGQFKLAEAAKEIENKADDERFDKLLGLADENPLEAPGLIEQYYKEGKITAAQKLRLDNVAQSSRNARRADDNEVIKAAFMGGKLKEPAELEAFPHLTEGDKAEWTQQLKKPVMNDGAEYDSVLAVIEKYDPSKDETGWEGAAISSRISQKFTLGYEKTLSGKLAKKIQPDDSVSKDFTASTKSVFEAAEQASMMPITEMVDGVMRPVMREAKPVGDLPEVETRTKETFMGIDWLNPDTVTKRDKARLYEGGEAVKLDKEGKPKTQPMRPIMAPEANALRVNNAKAKAVSEQLEREYNSPNTRKKWDADPVLLENRKFELMRAQGLPVVPSAMIGPSASLVDPAGVGYKAMSAEQLAKGQ